MYSLRYDNRILLEFIELKAILHLLRYVHVTLQTSPCGVAVTSFQRLVLSQ